MFKMLFLEHIQMGELIVVGLSVYQKPVGLYMTFDIPDNRYSPL